MHTRLFITLLAVLGCSAVQLVAAEPTLELVGVKKIWDEAPHNAFTDLVRFGDKFYCVFREGAGHVSPDGALRVIVSEEGGTWRSAALLKSELADLRDAKITVTPDHRLMLSGAMAYHGERPHRHQSLAWFSSEGTTWSEPVLVADPNVWLWRVTWNGPTAYGIGYGTVSQRFIRLYKSDYGRDFQTLVRDLGVAGYPNETSMLFLPDQTALCLLRRDGNPGSGLLGESRPPYTRWEWKDLGIGIGGPHMIRLPDGRLLAAVRLYDGGARTSLCWVDAEGGKLTEALKLPSGGDTSYAGLVWHDGLLWISYYSSHEGKTSIYLAKLKVPFPAPRVDH